MKKNEQRVMTLPATPEEALEELEGIGQLMYVNGWRKAALVYVLTTNETKGRPKKGSNTGPFPIKAFAKKGITGLKSHETVRLYRERWEEYGDTSIQLGDAIVIPSDDWPPTRTGTDGYESEEGLKKTIEKAKAKHGSKKVAEVIAEDTELTANIAAEMEPKATSSGNTGGELLDTMDAMGAMREYGGLVMNLPDALAAVTPHLRSGAIPDADKLIESWKDALKLELIMLDEVLASVKK